MVLIERNFSSYGEFTTLATCHAKRNKVLRDKLIQKLVCFQPLLLLAVHMDLHETVVNRPRQPVHASRFQARTLRHS